MRKIFKYFLIFIVISFIVVFISYYSKANASTKLEGIDKFPSSYQGYLRELSRKHPNWKFTALYTNLDWNYVINNENVFGKNLVPKNYSDNWKNTKPGEYNVEVDREWVDASRKAVEYCMDPRNFLNEVRIFQFETLSYDEHTNNLEGIEKILYGTEFYNRKVSYLDANGNNINMNEKYSNLILKAGQISKVSPYHLASRIKQEVGPFLTHNSISGTVDGFKGLYNFYNIGATSSAEPLGAIKNGLRFSKDGKGASSEIKNKYLIPWNTKEKAITGGAIFIGASYINVGQNSIYLQKFDVNDERSNSLFWHQYMTNVLAPYSESQSIYKGYQKIGLLDSKMSFIIPVYENMPQIQAPHPDTNVSVKPPVEIEKIELSIDNNVLQKGETKKLEVKILPEEASSHKVIYSSSKPSIVAVDDKGNITGIHSGIATITAKSEENDVQFKIDIIVYSKVTDIILDQTEIYMQIDDTFKINGIINPDDANEKGILYVSENNDIAIVDETGTITAKQIGETNIIASSKENSNIKSECKVIVVRKMDDSEIHFSAPLKVDSLEISGIDYKANTVSDIKKLIITDLEIDIVNNKGQLLKDTDLVGTGSRIRVKEDGKILRQYKIILYGDDNGDGKINGIDLLVLQRHILEIEKMDDIYMKAVNVRKTAPKPTSIDLLLIQRHILEIQFIEQ